MSDIGGPTQSRKAIRPRTVRVVGVMGCSAAGKTTFAHELASALHAPCFPISLDHFFFPEKCEHLGTFEDCRTLNLDAFQAAVRELVSILQLEPQETWRTAVMARVPVLAAYFPAPPGEQFGLSYTDAEEGEEPAQHSSADASLCAHEAEDLARRSRGFSPALVASRAPPGLHATEEVVHVVCEGFLLFARLDIASALFDAMLEVTAEPETACWRRFHRLPRRQQKPLLSPPPASEAAAATPTRPVGMYEKRIRQMWHTRTEARRLSLCEDLEARLRQSRAFAESEHAQTTPIASLAACASAFHTWLPPRHFFPPGLEAVTAENAANEADDVPSRTPWWDLQTGEPTRRFVDVVLGLAADAGNTDVAHETGDSAAAAAAPSSFMSWSEDAVLSAEAWQGLKAQLHTSAQRTCPRETTDSCATTSIASKDSNVWLEHRYAEFRYWFVYEVLYYHAFYLPLQQYHVQVCRELRPMLFHGQIANTGTTTRDELARKAAETAAQLVRHFAPHVHEARMEALML